MADNIPKIRPFHFYVQKVLPLVYDDALSYLEVLEKVKVKLNEVVDNINSWTDFTEDYTDQEIAKLRAELIQYINQQDNELQNLLAQAVNKLNADMSALRAEYQQSDAELRLWVNNQIVNIQNQFAQFVKDVQSEMAGFRAYVDSQDALVVQHINDEVERLEGLIREIELNPVQKVINPVDEKVAYIQDALDSMFYNLKSWGLRAKNYDALGLNAQEYDSYTLGAWNYDYLGKWYLREKPELQGDIKDAYIKAGTLFSPFMGVVESTSQVIYEMAAYIRVFGLTAEEYSAMGWTAQDYQDLNMTAYQYDWLAKQIVYGVEPYIGLTAEEYDKAQVITPLLVSL